MIICGLKLTHDGAIALIDNGRLIFSYEMEKLNNNPRYSTLMKFFDYDFLGSILNEYGYTVDDIDRFAIDGWWGNEPGGPEDTDYPKYTTRMVSRTKEEFQIELARYGLLAKEEDLLEASAFDHADHNFAFNSYMHVTGHVLSAYCTSPFAQRQEDSFVMVWDGGMFPQVFYFNAGNRTIENLGALFHMLGNSYSVFATNHPPFNVYDKDNMSVAGKVMAYIALGKTNEEILAKYRELFEAHENEIAAAGNLSAQELVDRSSNLLKEFVIQGEIMMVEPADQMATLHIFFQEVLVEKLQGFIKNHDDRTKNFCSVGGCALNIKWNSKIRNSGMFNEIWVPPFPNDAGSAIGAACSEMVNHTSHLDLSWDVYKGPFLKNNNAHDQWENEACTIEELAQILHEYDEPVVFLNGRAELGPRALGNRSILAAPVNSSMKLKLNKAKNREDYRPVAPICIEEYAPDIFLPGSPDPYMLFDHKVRPDWLEKIPAICHLDGTARLQTVGADDNPEVYRLLQAYNDLSGVPLLCNTSANYNGKGFFPDVLSVMEWGKVNIIWSEGKIYARKGEAFHNKSRLFAAKANAL